MYVRACVFKTERRRNTASQSVSRPDYTPDNTTAATAAICDLLAVDGKL